MMMSAYHTKRDIDINSTTEMGEWVGKNKVVSYTHMCMYKNISFDLFGLLDFDILMSSY